MPHTAQNYSDCPCRIKRKRQSVKGNKQKKSWFSRSLLFFHYSSRYKSKKKDDYSAPNRDRYPLIFRVPGDLTFLLAGIEKICTRICKLEIIFSTFVIDGIVEELRSLEFFCFFMYNIRNILVE